MPKELWTVLANGLATIFVSVEYGHRKMSQCMEVNSSTYYVREVYKHIQNQYFLKV